MDWQLEQLPTPMNYLKTRNSFDVQSGEPVPAVVVISPGLLEVPTHPESNGSYNSVWQVGIGVATSQRDEELADDVSKMYGAAVRAILVQHQSLERDDVIEVRWIDETYDDLPSVENQIELYKSAELNFGIAVEGSVSRWMGPALPTEDATVIGEADTVITEIPDWEKTVTSP